MQAKRKLLTALLTLCMVLMLVPTAALAYGEGQHMSVKTGGFVDEDECGCFEIDGITYAPLSESTVAVVNPKQHPVVLIMTGKSLFLQLLQVTVKHIPLP